jgi:hypothetical protein
MFMQHKFITFANLKKWWKKMLPLKAMWHQRVCVYVFFFHINKLEKFSKINQICTEKENFQRISNFFVENLAEFLQGKKTLLVGI